MTPSEILPLEPDAPDRPRQREQNAGIRDDRQVRMQLFAAVEPMRDWQLEAAHLRALLDSAKAGSTRETAARIFSLRHAVNEARTKVDSIVESLPDRLRRHGRVIDIMGALDRLEALIAALDGKPER